MQHQPRADIADGRPRRAGAGLGASESATEADENRPATAAAAFRTCRKLDIRARIRHDSRDAVLRDAVLRGAGLTRRRIIRS
ncbi:MULTISPECIES: hypothetical protein [Methylobacterium]|uniref:hypothetical protein n=1 Tax=Methylobacterium TaxID=407 RepID=UPI002F3504BF